MEWVLGGMAVALLAVGLIGQGFEMRRINAELGEQTDEMPSPPNVFADKRNIKWYALIGIGILMWFAAERL